MDVLCFFSKRKCFSRSDIPGIDETSFQFNPNVSGVGNVQAMWPYLSSDLFSEAESSSNNPGLEQTNKRGPDICCAPPVVKYIILKVISKYKNSYGNKEKIQASNLNAHSARGLEPIEGSSEITMRLILRTLGRTARTIFKFIGIYSKKAEGT